MWELATCKIPATSCNCNLPFVTLFHFIFVATYINVSRYAISKLSNHQTRNHYSIHRIAELPKYGHSTYAIDFISCIVETENESLSTKLFCNEIG